MEKGAFWKGGEGENKRKKKETIRSLLYPCAVNMKLGQTRYIPYIRGGTRTSNSVNM